jgi:hypothetical protein
LPGQLRKTCAWGAEIDENVGRRDGRLGTSSISAAAPPAGPGFEATMWLALVMLGWGAAPLAPAMAAPSDFSYELDLRLDREHRTIAGRETIRLRSARDGLTVIVFPATYELAHQRCDAGGPGQAVRPMGLRPTGR